MTEWAWVAVWAAHTDSIIYWLAATGGFQPLLMPLSHTDCGYCLLRH